MAIIRIIGVKDSARRAGLEEQQNFDNQVSVVAIELLMETRVFISNISRK